MTTRRVYHGGSNTSPYDTWAKAATTFGTAVSASAAGDEIWVADDHAESGASFSYTFPSSPDNPVKVLSVSRADDSLSPAAVKQIDATSSTITINGSAYFNGFNLEWETALALMTGNSFDRQVYDSCTLTCAFTGSSSNVGIINNTDFRTKDLIFRGCSFSFSHSSGAAINIKACILYVTDCAFTLGNAILFVSSGCEAGSAFVVEDCDLSGFLAALLTLTSTRSTRGVLRRCRLPASWSVADGTDGGQVLLDSCASGTISAPPLCLSNLSHPFGTVKSDLSRYRTGGADDGAQANAHSWEMVSNASALELYNPLESMPITRWVASGSQTLTIYVASGVTLQDDEFWIEVHSPDEGGSPTAQGTFTSTRLAPLGTPANLTTDGTSTWNGTGVGTKQKVSVSITPAVAGPVTIRCFLAKPSTTVYVDPQVIVS